MSDQQIGTEIGAGAGGVAGSYFGPIGTAVGSGLGGLIGSMFNPKDSNQDQLIADNERKSAEFDLGLARSNQSFWDNWHQQFNPQSPVMSTPTSAPAYAANAQAAQGRAAAESAIVPTGSMDMNALNRGVANQDISKSRTEDLNSYLNNMRENQNNSNNREMSMFGTMENMNNQNENLFQNAFTEREGHGRG